MTTRRTTEDRRTELVDRALALIESRGIAALSTRALAADAGLSSGAIFKHFPSLADLLGAVVARVEAVLDATYPPDGLAPVDRLAAFVDARSGAVGRQRGILRLVLSEQFRLSMPEAAAKRLVRVVERTRRFLVETLREGQASGDFRGDLAAEDLALVVMGTLQAAALVPAGRGRVPGATSVRDVLLVLVAGSRVPVPTSPRVRSRGAGRAVRGPRPVSPRTPPRRVLPASGGA